MKRFLGAWFAAALLAGFGQGTTLQADDKDAMAVLDKAIAALGGEAKLAKAGSVSWKGKGTITFNDNENPIKTKTTLQGIDHHRAEFEGEFNGNDVKGVTILSVNKGWRKFGEETQDLDDEALATEKRRAYLQAVPATILPLKGKDFKVELAPEEKVDGKPASAIKATGPDGKTFTLAFDKETGLPVKLTATVRGWQGEDFVQETTFSGFKEFSGIKWPTKTESKRDGNPFVKLELSDFKVEDKLDPETFAEPK